MSATGTGRATIDPWLLERLVCPLTRTPLRLDEAACELVSTAAGLAYPIRDGVPVMLVEVARRLGPDDAVSAPASETQP
ncbi:Trm112 family protein [Sphingomonas sp. NBWT7]|uniref:Trm112 family protein n=1 Tax=Sphingomonas sp. NBWT7 TaxID=2596913 RepID=UPI0016251494|nr:Trm112 family protein [Sphingomonas sp. NBWT7]QNE32869.1 Trm112 family protein [Sphingomonas sp. NBWT7]